NATACILQIRCYYVEGCCHGGFKMFTQSIWNTYSDETEFPPLREDITVDTVIIGGGITGITAASMLAAEGRKVVVLEALKVGGGTTGHSTGNLYAVIDHGLSTFRSKYDVQTLKDVLTARTHALQLIEHNIHKHQLDCDFNFCNWYLYSGHAEADAYIEQEFEAAREAGLEVQEADPAELPFRVSRAIRLRDQAQFNPMLYVRGLAKSIQTDNCRIYESTAVESLTEEGGMCRVETPTGTVHALHAIQATHTPKGFSLLHTMLGPYREYGIACKLRAGMPEPGIFWGYPQEGEKYSTRSYLRGQDRFLIVVGRPHKVGQKKDNQECLLQLERFAEENFPVAEVAFRWGGQHYRPADLLPYIGRTDKDSNIFIATGFSTDGLLYGALAGNMIANMIQGKINPWEELFDPSRRQPLKAAKNFIKENANVFVQYLKDLPGIAETRDFADIAPGEGKIVEQKLHKLAVCRTLEGQLLVRSAICTHLACVVNWNGAEQTWDCPCHGSRFKPDGSVLEGPALRALHEVEIRQDKGPVYTDQQGEFSGRNPRLF
ncbi:MAG TPA: FAD-dependent oxidoreductase, partial [Gammaproteobacteria bacterium]